MNPSRRRFLTGLSVLAVAPLLAACTDDGAGSSHTGGSTGRGAPEE
ncbi:MAG: hypothetical protein JWN22_812, partial [Nocardioides sp.]|nr:hypothetical protein [Nocardioides sp.]